MTTEQMWEKVAELKTLNDEVAIAKIVLDIYQKGAADGIAKLEQNLVRRGTNQ